MNENLQESENENLRNMEAIRAYINEMFSNLSARDRKILCCVLYSQDCHNFRLLIIKKLSSYDISTTERRVMEVTRTSIICLSERLLERNFIIMFQSKFISRFDSN